MRQATSPLNVPATATTGSAFPCGDLMDKWVQIVGIAGGATFAIEGTIDGSNWIALTISVVADGIYEVPQNVASVRLNRTVLGSGTITASVSYRDDRTL